MKYHTIRLRGSGSALSLRRLPDEFITSIINVIAAEEDPFTALAGFAYMVNGLKVSEIKDRFILIDQGKVRVASREYVRQKIVRFYNNIRIDYELTHPTHTITVLHDTSNIECNVGSYSYNDINIKEPINEDFESEKEDVILEEEEEIFKGCSPSDFDS